MRWRFSCISLLCSFFLCPDFAQASDNSQSRDTVCTFADGKQMKAIYMLPDRATRTDLPIDQIWGPGNSPLTLFTQAVILIQGKEIPPGAFSMWFIPEKDNWTLVLNKEVTAGSQYDEKKDLLRATMNIGHISAPQPFSIVFAHVGPKQCNLRIYHGKIGTWAEFKEK